MPISATRRHGPVVDGTGRAILGILRRQDVLSAYQARIDVARPRGR